MFCFVFCKTFKTMHQQQNFAGSVCVIDQTYCFCHLVRVGEQNRGQTEVKFKKFPF